MSQGKKKGGNGILPSATFRLPRRNSRGLRSLSFSAGSMEEEGWKKKRTQFAGNNMSRVEREDPLRFSVTGKKSRRKGGRDREFANSSFTTTTKQLTLPLVYHAEQGNSIWGEEGRKGEPKDATPIHLDSLRENRSRRLPSSEQKEKVRRRGRGES